MRFTATDEQVKQIFCNAVQHSFPSGMGFLHYKEDQVFEPKMLRFTKRYDKETLDADYVQGRMVKLTITREKDNIWEIVYPQGDPRSSYQSWAGKYPTLFDLVASVSGTDVLD